MKARMVEKVSRSRALHLAAILAACLWWAPVAEAQRPGAEPRSRGTETPRAGAESQRTAARAAALPDLTCTVYITDTENLADPPMPDGGRVTWAQDKTCSPFCSFYDPTYHVWATVTNLGHPEARFIPAIAVSLNGVELPAPYHDTATLAPQGSKTYGPYPIGPLPDGNYYRIVAKFMTDVGNTLTESNETNNTCDSRVTITPSTPFSIPGGGPRLALSSADVSTNSEASVRVVNTGTAPFDGPFAVTVVVKGDYFHIVQHSSPAGVSFQNEQGFCNRGEGLTIEHSSRLDPGDDVELTKAIPGFGSDPDCPPDLGPGEWFRGFIATFTLRDTRGTVLDTAVFSW